MWRAVKITVSILFPNAQLNTNMKGTRMHVTHYETHTWLHLLLTSLSKKSFLYIYRYIYLSSVMRYPDWVRRLWTLQGMRESVRRLTARIMSPATRNEMRQLVFWISWGTFKFLETSNLLSKELDMLDNAIRTRRRIDNTALYVLRQEHNSSSIFAGVNWHARQCHSHFVPSSS